MITFILLLIPLVVGYLLGLRLEFSSFQWMLAIIAALLFDVFIIIPTKIGMRYIHLITPRLRIELEQSPEVNNEHIWWHLIVHNDSIKAIDDCYAQLLSFTPNLNKRLYQAVHLPWSSFGGQDMETATIPGKSFRYFDVVMTNKKDLYVLTFAPNPSLRGTPFSEPPGQYELVIQVGSNRQSFMPSKIKLEAIFSKDGNLDVKEVK